MRFIFLIVVTLSPWIVSAQSYFLNNYATEDGLPDLNIHSIEQDHLGYLWIGSSDGLTKFDGLSFEEIKYLHDNENDEVFDLLLDKNKILWIASKNGVTSYNGSTFKYYGVQNIDSPWNCYDLSETPDNEIVFFNGPNYVYRIKNGEVNSWKDLLPEPGLGRGRLITSKTGAVFYFNLEGSIWKLVEGKFVLIPKRYPNIKTLEARSGDSLLVSTSKGIKEIILGEEENSNEAFLYEADSIAVLLYHSNNDIWFARNKKIYRINTIDTLILDHKNGYTGGDIKGLYEDSEGNIWINTVEKGLYYFHGDVLNHIQFNKNSTFSPTSFAPDDSGNIWISYFGSGANLFRNNEVRNYSKNEGLASDYIRHVIKNDDGIWFITARGITLFDGEAFKSYSILNGLPHNYCFYACVDQQRRLWVATEGGIGIFDGKRFSQISKSDGLLNNRIKYMLPRFSNSMLLLSDNGIDEMMNDNINSYISNEFKEKEILNTMAEDIHDNLWIGSDINGLIHHNKLSNSLTYINERQQLPFSRVRTIDFLSDNKIILGTEKGIYVADISINGNINNTRSIGVDIGFPDFEVNTNASKIIEDKIYFGTSVGVIVLNPLKLVHVAKDIPLHISAVDLEFKQTDWESYNITADSWVNVPQKTYLQYDQNDLMIHFQGVSLLSKGKLSYKFILENHDQTWSQPSHNESVIYANLRPGKYTFRVSASYDGLNWNEKDTSYSFVILQPFWKTWWFYLVVFSFLLAGFITINNYRIRTRINQLLLIEKLNKEEYEKIQKKVAMDFHDEVGNHLTSISLLVQLIKNRSWEVPSELKEMLNKIDIESKNLFQGTKDFIWSIDPKNDNLKEVFHNIRDYGEELFDNSDIIFHAANGFYDIEKIILPAGFTRQIVLIFKEGINNALKHAGCKNVHFSIKIGEKYFEIRLVDDGRGFKTEEVNYYNGLKKMKSRGDKIKSELSFKSQIDTGTEIILKANLNKN